MSGPIRGLHDVEGKLFAVSGRTLYQMSNAGVAIPRGTIPGTGRVGMAHNQKAGGNELIVVNGSGGYVWNTANETFSVIVDEGYPGAAVVDFVDGYLMQVEPFGRFLFHSNLADALDYNTLDRFEAETAPDRVVGMIVNHQEVWAFNERTIDVFGNTGSAQGTFQNKGVSIARGCAAKWSPAIIDNGTAWLGDDGKVYHATGYSPQRISTRATEVAIGECAKSDIRNAFSFVWEDRSHAVYYLTIPNGPTFGFDFSTRLWHRRASWHPEHDIAGRWRLSDLVKHNGDWIGGDYQNGKLYKLDWDYMMEGCDPLVRSRTTPFAHNNGARFTADEIELLVTSGGEMTECAPFPYQPVGPTITGSAPDGVVGEAYSFTYTVTPGDGAIVDTVIRSGTLLPGLTWDASTATISGTPTATGPVDLLLRTRDANGLHSDHADYFVVSAYILALGSPGIGQYGVLQITDSTDFEGDFVVRGGSTISALNQRRAFVRGIGYTPGYSDNRGDNWSDSTGFVEVGSGASIGVAIDNTVVFPCDDGSINRSADNSTSFSQVNGSFTDVRFFGEGPGGRFVGATAHSVSNTFIYSDDDALSFTNGANIGIVTSGGCIASHAGTVVVGGKQFGGGKPAFAVTTDGGETVRIYTIPDAQDDVSIRSACAGQVGDRVVWVFGLGNGSVYSTDDFEEAQVWDDALPHDVNGLGFDGVRFVAGGTDSTYVLTSEDGVTTTRRGCVLDTQFYGIAVLK